MLKKKDKIRRDVNIAVDILLQQFSEVKENQKVIIDKLDMLLNNTEGIPVVRGCIIKLR